MNNSVLMRRGKTAQDMPRILKGFAHRQWPMLEIPAKCFAFQVLHHQIIDSILLADIEQRADVRVLQSGDGPRLAPESFSALRIGGDGRGKDLDRNISIQASVASAVYLAHSTRADGTHNLVRSEVSPVCEPHLLRRCGFEKIVHGAWVVTGERD
jgi:hypothetical protein